MSMPPPPPPAPPAPTSSPTGKDLVRTTWALLRQDRELLAVPLIGGVVGVLAVLPIALAALLVPEDAGWMRAGLGVVALVVLAIAGTFASVALAAGAHQRMEGLEPTLRTAAGQAWTRRWSVVQWALLSVTVGLLLALVESRVKVAGPILRLLGGVAWALAAMFVVPIIAVDDVGPFEALKASSSTFRSRWASAVRLDLRVGVYALVLALGTMVAIVAVVALSTVSLALAIVGGVVLAIPVLAGYLVLGAIGSYARVVLYRFSVGMATPGFSAPMLEAAMVTKQARRSRRSGT